MTTHSVSHRLRTWCVNHPALATRGKGREGKGRGMEGRKGGSVYLHLTTEPRETNGVNKINPVVANV